PTLDKAVAAAVIAAMSAAQFTGEANKSLTLFLEAGVFVLVGTGTEVGAGSVAEEVGGRIFSAVDGLEAKRACLPDQGLGDEIMADMLMGMMSAAYHFEEYFTETTRRENSVQITLVSDSLEESHQAISDRMGLMKGVEMARNLVFEPPNKLFPVEFATRCTALEDLGVDVSILDDDAMAELGMGALLGVGQGSRRDSRLVVMNWRGGADEAPIALVGKGVTFDTGGISLKPAKGMEDMKFDMGGAAAVTGTMMAVASRKVARNVVGVIGLVENMPDGNAQRPGDVVTSMSGKTIEVINTDAEGRLVLADALHYTQTQFKPQAMVDLATLTGAMIVALGKEYAGVFSNSDGLSEQLSKAGSATLEPVWRMPLGKAYHQQLKSHIADMKNIGGPAGGSITAACFLERFVTDTPWAHLDIAGKAWADKATKTVPKGGTGYGVRLLSRLIDDWQQVDVNADGI
ncbi:MAG: leucyl aminopeptidase, partial [Candidatus Puniceispirillaceae bacterium]